MVNPTPILTLAADHLWQSAILAALLSAFAPAARAWPPAARCRLYLVLLAAAVGLPLCALLPQVQATTPPPISPAALVPSLPALPSMPPLIPWATLAIWAATTLVLLARLALDLHRLTTLVRSAVPAPSMALPGADVAVSPRVAGPMVVGYFRPLILVPPRFAQANSSAHRRALLEHERAHILRHDTSVALAQRLLAALFWWSPALYWINARIDEQREMACDEFAAGAVGDPALFAKALIVHAHAMVEATEPPLAMAIARHRSRLAHRIQQLLATPPDRPRIATSVAMLSAFAVTLFGIAIATPPLRISGSTSGPIAETIIQPIRITYLAPPYVDDGRFAQQDALATKFRQFDAVTEKYRHFDATTEKYRGYGVAAAAGITKL